MMNSQNITPSLAVSLSPMIHFSALQLFVWLYSLQLSVMVHFNSYITNTHKANPQQSWGIVASARVQAAGSSRGSCRLWIVPVSA